VRYVPRRANIPGTLDYPGIPPDPHVPSVKEPEPRDRLQFYPRMFIPEHPRRWEFPAYLDNPNCKWLQQLKVMYSMPISFPASLSPEAGLLVHSLVRNLRPRVVIETGTFVGMSTLWIAAALAENGDDGEIHTFDDFAPMGKGPWRDVEMLEGRMEFVAAMLAEAGLKEHVVIHPGNSSFEIRAAHEEFKVAGGVQLAFLDADHGVVGSWQDMWATEPVLNTGGFVLFHDIFPEYCGYEGGRHVLDNLDGRAVGVYEKVDMYLSPMNYGMGLIRRIG
jgi:predicted O-methyltransferase YrrM